MSILEALFGRQNNGQQAQLPATATPGAVQRGPDGRAYQYAETRGMAGASGDFGWIPTNMEPKQGLLSQLLDPAVALPMAGALLGNQGNSANFGNAFSAAGPAMAQQKLTAQGNKTGNFLRKQDPRYAEMLDNGFQPKEVYELYLQDRKAQNPADPYKVVDGQIFDTRDKSFLAPPTGSGAPETGLNTVMLRNKEGVTIYAQPTKDGRLLASQVPEGFEPYDPYSKALATGSGAAAGKAQGEALATYQSMSSKMPGLEQVITKLDGLSEKATYTLAGQGLDAGMRQMGMDPREAAVARSEYIATVDNQVLPLLRDTFGAAFTVKEGDTLRATLGDPNKTPQEKQVVLRAFIEQKRRDVEALAAQASATPGYNPQGGQPQGGGVVDYTDYFRGQ